MPEVVWRLKIERIFGILELKKMVLPLEEDPQLVVAISMGVGIMIDYHDPILQLQAIMMPRRRSKECQFHHNDLKLLP